MSDKTCGECVCFFPDMHPSIGYCSVWHTVVSTRMEPIKTWCFESKEANNADSDSVSSGSVSSDNPAGPVPHGERFKSQPIKEA